MNAWEVVDAVAVVLAAEPWRIDTPNKVERRLTLAHPDAVNCSFKVRGFLPANRIVIVKAYAGSWGYRDRDDFPEVVIETPTVEHVLAVLHNFNAYRTDWHE